MEELRLRVTSQRGTNNFCILNHNIPHVAEEPAGRSLQRAHRTSDARSQEADSNNALCTDTTV
ncbi:hypothetical protein ABVT39_024112, partial [Epinephelus coioides]